MRRNDGGVDVAGILFAALAFLLLWGALCAWLADQKGRDPVAWFILGCLLSVVALLVLGFSPSVEEDDDELVKTCPQCAEEVKAEALICRFCRSEFQPSAGGAPTSAADTA